MNRALVLLLATAAVFVGVYLLPKSTDGDSDTAARSKLQSAYSRAVAYYINETNADYRKARLELEPFAEQLDGSVPYHIDMALIDLAEINKPVQNEDRIIGAPSNHQLLLESALEHMERARALDADNEAVAYNLARTYQKLASGARNATELRAAAERLLKPLVEGDRPDAAALIVYAELKEIAQEYEVALAAYEKLVGLGEDFLLETQYSVGQWRRARLKSRLGDRGALEEFLKNNKKRPTPKRLVLESGRYTAFLPLLDPPAIQPDIRDMKWRRVTERALLPKAGTPRYFIAPDLDNDCRRDLVMNAADGLRVLRSRRSASFEDQTATCGVPQGFELHAAAAADIDNNGLADLVIGGPTGVRILLNTTDSEQPGKWEFVDVTADRLGARGAEPAHCIVLWDFDHDGDIDIFVGGETNRLYRTAIEEPPTGGRDLVFTEMAEKLGMHQPAAFDALMLDVEDDHDVDLVISRGRDTGAPSVHWFENLRELQFKRHSMAPVRGPLAAGDINNDGVEELLVGGTTHKFGDGEWTPGDARPALLDLNGDGVIDADPFAGIDLPGELVHAVGTDLNRDGASDLLLMTDAGLDLYMSRPDRPMAWVDIMPRGFKANELGIGTRLQLFSGDLRIGTTCRDGLVSFGLGRRTVIDAITLRWTNGVEQGEVLPAITACLTIEEREGEVGSCPFLYAFDGKRWHFINDCHSGTPLGLPYKDGAYLPPRSNETVFIPGDKLAVVDGTLRLDLAEEFRELFYVDSVVLRAIDHPKHVRPVLNEGFKVFTHPKFHVHGFTDLQPPRSAKDHKGRDITELVSKRDTRHAVVWDKLDSRFVGLAHKWSIELDFGDLSKHERVMFVMDGWVEFPTASASIAASQTKSVQFMPPMLEVIGKDGKWVVADKDPGFPAGKGKAVLVDMSGKFATSDGRIRITSTQRLHWDAFSVSTGDEGPRTLTVLPIVSADHGWRGVGKRVEEPGQPWRYSHSELETFYRWDQMPMGMLTRYGDVKELMTSIDDRYPVLASGDVVRLVFDASALPELPDGWVRDYCFTTEGWVKDADMNQAVRERVGPLPFHGMGGYPYDEKKQAHPHPDWVKEWFTRPARRLVNPESLKK